MSNNAGNTLVAVLTGVAIGAGIGILFAPDKGSKTRGKIKDGFDTASLELKDKFTSAKYDLEETYEELVSNMSHKTEDVISFLEEKLAELKRQNAKLQK
ncbi:YtxH domain-containing protein [Flavobacterium sp. ZB4P13]|uniref:YtxH domain-containing protein n=1 Tax=Flavobacterium sp. ZB4P13 TaxID=3401728 RepID=UPI003AAF8E1F